MLSDPYYDVRHEVQTSIKEAQRTHDRWKHVLQTDGAARGAQQLQRLQAEIARDFSLLEDDHFKALDSVILHIERNRAEYPNIDDREIASRKSFLRSCRADVKAIRDSINDPKVKQKVEADQRAQLLAGGSSSRASKREDMHRDRAKLTAEGHMDQQLQEQAQIEANVDGMLEDVSKRANRIKETLLVLTTEASRQNQQIEEINEEHDNQLATMNVVYTKMGQLMNTSDTRSICVVITLIVISLLLVTLILST